MTRTVKPMNQMTKTQAIKEALEYFGAYSEFKLNRTGVPMKVRVVELWHDCMGNRFDEPTYAWHDYSEDVFAKDSWKDEPTVIIIE